jgi:hypothetical protein
MGVKSPKKKGGKGGKAVVNNGTKEAALSAGSQVQIEKPGAIGGEATQHENGLQTTQDIHTPFPNGYPVVTRSREELIKASNELHKLTLKEGDIVSFPGEGSQAVALAETVIDVGPAAVREEYPELFAQQRERSESFIVEDTDVRLSDSEDASDEETSVSDASEEGGEEQSGKKKKKKKKKKVGETAQIGADLGFNCLHDRVFETCFQFGGLKQRCRGDIL